MWREGAVQCWMALKNFPSLVRSWFWLYRSRWRPASSPSFLWSSYTWEKSENPTASRKVMCFTRHAKVSSKCIYFSPTVQRQLLAAPNPSPRDVKGWMLSVLRENVISRVCFPVLLIFPLIAYTSHRSLKSLGIWYILYHHKFLLAFSNSTMSCSRVCQEEFSFKKFWFKCQAVAPCHLWVTVNQRNTPAIFVLRCCSRCSRNMWIWLYILDESSCFTLSHGG